MIKEIKFIDLESQKNEVSNMVIRNILNVVEGLDFVGGKYVSELESELCAFSGSKYVAACGSGTDALILALKALNIQPGDKVICPSYTFTATAEAIVLTGGQPVFIDVDIDSYNLCPIKTREYLKDNRDIKGVISVDIFGNPCEYNEFRKLCDEFGLFYISDAAQSFGSQCNGIHSVNFADISTTSFYPAKPLGCYGDGGALFTSDEIIYKRLLSLRNHGQGEDRYIYNEIGMCSRLDTIQAGVLLAKLSIFDKELESRDLVAQQYNINIPNILNPQRVTNKNKSAWAQYTINISSLIDGKVDVDNYRDILVDKIRSKGVPIQIYYGLPLHLQPPYTAYSCGNLDNTELLAKSTFSLPMHPYLSSEQVLYICDILKGVFYD